MQAFRANGAPVWQHCRSVAAGAARAGGRCARAAGIPHARPNRLTFTSPLTESAGLSRIKPRDIVRSFTSRSIHAPGRDATAVLISPLARREKAHSRPPVGTGRGEGCGSRISRGQRGLQPPDKPPRRQSSEPPAL
ncbi:unnamed protein product, partial [Iphiclides podalirius]